MAQYSMQLISLLQSAEEGPFSQAQDKSTPALSDGGNFKHYRRKKTNKAPRKRTFIANMTKQPTILTDSLAASAHGIGKVHGVSSATSAHDSSDSTSTPTGGSLQALQQQQRHMADAGLQGLPVLYPPVVFGSKQAPPPSRSPPPQNSAGQNQAFYYDAELAAALADYQPMGATNQTMGNSAFRAVTTALDELPPSTMARSIFTGLAQYSAPPAEQFSRAPASAAAQQMPPAAEPALVQRTSQVQAQPSSVPTASAPSYLPMLTLMGYEAMSAAAAAAACSKQHAQQAAQQQLRAASTPFSRITTAPQPPQQQQQQYSQASSMASVQTNLSGMPSDISIRSMGDAARHGYASPRLSSLQTAPTAVYPIAPVPKQPIRTASPPLNLSKAEPGAAVAAAPAKQLLVVPLEPSGWSRLPPRRAPLQPELMWSAPQQDDEQLWNPSRVICHTLINTGAYGAVYRGSLRHDDDADAARPSPFMEVAVKCLRPGLAPSKLLRSFQVEAELLPSLSHPHVVPVWYVNADPAAGAVCLVQELAPLGTLADYIHGSQQGLAQQQVERAVLSRLAGLLGVSGPQLMQRLGCSGGAGDAEVQAQAALRRQLVLLSLMRDVALALDYLATLPQPIVHRDIKPANVLIREQGMAMLADFGVAKLAPSAGAAEQLSQAWAGAASAPDAKRRRRSSDGTSQLSAHHGSPAAAYSPHSPGSPADSEETCWLSALLSEDLPVVGSYAQSGSVDEDSLGWLNQLLDQDEVVSSTQLAAGSKRTLAQSWGSDAGGNGWASEEPEQEQGGLAAAAHAVSSLLDHDLQGTAHYAAPEDMRPTAAAAAPAFPLGPAADVFSLGYCIWEALGAQRPWAGMKAAALANSVGVKGARLPINRGWSLRLQGLMRRVWQADPAARPAASEVAGVLEAEICALVAAA